MASDVLEMMQVLDIGSALVVGHSMGGRVAMVFSLAYPSMVDGMISIDMAPKEYPRGHDDIFEALERVDLHVESRKEAESVLAETIHDFGTRQFLMKNLSRKEGGEGFEWKMNLPVIKENYEDILTPIVSEVSYDGPALFIRGGRSSYILDEDLTMIRHFFPFAGVVTVEDAGHWVHADQPEATLTAISSFAEGL